MIDTIEKGWKLNIPIAIDERFPGDPPILVANAKKAQGILGWTPKYSDIQTIIETAWKWQNAAAPV